MAQHWTQKPENKERLRAMIAKSAAARKQSAAARRKRKPGSSGVFKKRAFREKMRAVSLARWQQRRAAGLGREGSITPNAEREQRHRAAVALLTPNGHAIGQRTMVKSTRGNLAKESYRQLALTGARTLLALIEEERETLLVFLKDGEKD